MTEAYRQCLEIQRLLIADIRRVNDPKERAALVAAFDRMLERKRILAQKPLPKAIDVTTRQRERKPLPEPAEPFETSEAKESTSEPEGDRTTEPPAP